MTKISILEIIGDSTLAGAPRHLLSILENLDRDKFKVSCICPPGPLAGEIKSIKPHLDLDVISMDSRFSLKSINRIRRAIDFIKPDLIHVHGTRAGALGRLAALGSNIPIVYTEHLWTHSFKLNNRFLNYLHHIGGWFLDLFTSQNIAVSQAVKDYMIAANISYAEKIEVIYNGIEPTKTKAKIFSDSQKIVLGTVGTLLPLKGFQFLIQALPEIRQEFPEVNLEIIGEGPFKPALVREVKKQKMEKFVKFLGFQADIEKCLEKIDLYIQPSISESFGLAVVQAMSVGLPVIVTRTGGLPEVVTEGKSGLLVEAGNKKELIKAILTLLRDRGLARRMGEAARRDAVTRFSLKDMIDQTENLYEKMVKNTSFPQ